ncbi:hypothetical protein QBC38DRAFT_549440 [Podospora fimiseda]|uniref:Uncharacterized protein n=1 Tax=Podospora fimiseda TaxID=252190 RepID=A0AAN7BDY1_9PEZI|nr:hypothetical protein QBC38DRAFT_549440 [Podospora fimiseda]
MGLKYSCYRVGCEAKFDMETERDTHMKDLCSFLSVDERHEANQTFSFKGMETGYGTWDQDNGKFSYLDVAQIFLVMIPVDGFWVELSTAITMETASETPSPPNTDSEFSRANLIALFLSLSLCLLTQPYGSLIYRPWPPPDIEASGFTAWMFWLSRLNPVHSLHESCYIFWSTGGLVLKLWAEDHGKITQHRFPLSHFAAANE